jgi:hypothetical protein
MSSPRCRLQLLELCERSLPSAVAPLPTPLAAPAAQVASHPLHGTGTGTYHGPAVTIDAGTSFTLSGTADLGSLGKFTVTGGVEGVGLIAAGRATGDLVLSDARGTITLKLHGPVQAAFSQPPEELVYTVTGGTGAFQHLGGYGAVGLRRIPAPVVFGHPPVGTVILTFS